VNVNHADEYNKTFNSIEEAIENVAAGGVVIVQSDVKSDNVIRIDEPINLIGCGKSKPAIVLGPDHDGIRIKAKDVYIENISIIGGNHGIIVESAPNCTLANNEICSSSDGIYIYRSDNCNIQGNVITHAEENCGSEHSCAINLIIANNNIINNNIIDNMDTGILLTASHNCNIQNNTMNIKKNGIVLDKIEDAKINKNIIINMMRGQASTQGIALMNSKNVLVYYNNISNFYTGLSDQESYDINISYNTLDFINNVGIYLDESNAFDICNNSVSADDSAIYAIHICNINCGRSRNVNSILNNNYNDFLCGIGLEDISGDIIVLENNEGNVEGCQIYVHNCDLRKIMGEEEILDRNYCIG